MSLTDMTTFVITKVVPAQPLSTANGDRLFTNLVLDDMAGNSIGVVRWHNTPRGVEPTAKALLEEQAAWLKAIEPIVESHAIVKCGLTWEGSVYQDSQGRDQAGNRITLIGFTPTGDTYAGSLPQRASSYAF